MKILYVTTISDSMVFFPRHIEMLLDQGNTVDMACNVKRPIDPLLLKRGCRVYDVAFTRNPFNKKNYAAYKQLKDIISKENYDIVHTHTPTASACVRLACRNMKNVKVYYTAHGFHFFHGASIMNWLFYYPIEWWLSRYTDLLITINQEDYQRAKKAFKARQVVYVPGVGVDVARFKEAVADRLDKRREIGVPDNAVLILSVGELIKNKNHATVIKVIARLKDPNIFCVICGSGQLQGYLRALINKLGVDKQVILLGTRNDIDEICNIADIFIHPSYREGLPVAVMEAMAAGLPCVVSRIRGNTDLIHDGKGGYICRPNDVDGYCQAVLSLAADESRRKAMGDYNQEIIVRFDINKVLTEMKCLYERDWEAENKNFTSVTK